MKKVLDIFRLNINPDRIYGLDILRAIAVLFVVAGHSNAFLPVKMQIAFGYLLFDGVAIFFVLSGFLIGTILIKMLEKEPVSMKLLFDFWLRRWLRTLPNYFFVTTLLVFIVYFYSDTFKQIDFKSYYLFLQNFSKPVLLFFPESWSLSVEEWFYLIVPASIFILSGIFKLNYKTSVLLVALSLIIIVPVYRYYRFSMLHQSITAWEWGLKFYFPVITRLDSLMYGIIGAFIYCFNLSLWIKYKNLLFITGLVLLFFHKFRIVDYPLGDYSSIYTCVFSFTVNAIAILCLVPFLTELKSGRGFVYKVITYISLISYSMYLINLSLIKIWVLDFFIKRSLNFYEVNLTKNLTIIMNFGLFWIFTLLGSILLYKYLELPFMNLRNRKKKNTVTEKLA